MFRPSVDLVLADLDSKDVASMSMTSPEWNHYVKKDFFDTVEREWPVATRSRRILSELASAFGGAIIRPAYDWKQVFRYLESIKSDVDASIAIHEQLLSLTALAHFLLITDDMDDHYKLYLTQTVEWISLSAKILVNTIESLVDRENRQKTLELVASLFGLYSRLVDEWVATFVSDLYKTHVIPIFDTYNESNSAEEALETLILIAESFLKARDFSSALWAAIAPLNALTTTEPLQHLPAFNLKPGLIQALKNLPENVKSSLFKITFACDGLRADHVKYLYPLEDYFSIIDEPALAAFMPRDESRSFKVPRYASVLFSDESRLYLPIKHLERFETISLDLEHALRVGNRLHLDESLDSELRLPNLILRSDLATIEEFSALLDDIEALDDENREDAMINWTQKFLENPRDLAVLLLASREIGLVPLQNTIEKVMKRLIPLQDPTSEKDIEASGHD